LAARISKAAFYQIRLRILRKLENAVNLGLIHPDQAREYLLQIGLAQQVRRPRMVAVRVQTFPHVLYPWDPAVLKAIHEFDPRVIPVWINRVYVTPTGGTIVVGRHGIASHVPAVDRHQQIDPIFYRALTGIHGSIERPTQLDFHVEHRNGFGGLPGEYLPFDWRVYRILRSTFNEWTWKEREDYRTEHGEEAQKAAARQAAEAEKAYAAKTDEAFLQRHIDQFDDDDAKRIAAGGEHFKATPMVEMRQEQSA
jgi:hypothetical protein